ncbi:MAG: nucleotidyltransferase family protein [Thermoanaerobaculia bacterium]|nr:nucleotidyltransferase family protein [Thermoanaerobaculia bacterium]
MRGDGFRFDPPAFAVTPGIAWALRRAFGPVEVEIEPGDADAAVEMAERLAVAARIAARVAGELLAAEVGDEGAARLRTARARAAASGMLVLEAAREVAEVAARAGIEVASLKFAGLAALGLPVLGRRGVGDLDLLVAPEEAGRLAEVLVGAGFRGSGGVAYEHHLAGLRSPAGTLVEIHTRLPGVRLREGGRRRSGISRRRGCSSGRARSWRRGGCRGARWCGRICSCMRWRSMGWRRRGIRGCG